MTRSYPNGLTRFTTPRFTLSDITPLTYRDGETYASLLWRLFRHVTEVLNPSIETSFRELITQLESEMAKAEHQYVDGVQEFQRIHDAFMSDVNAHLIALNDGAVSDLVEDESSLIGKTLRELFVPGTGLDDAVANNVKDDLSATHHAVQRMVDSVDVTTDLENLRTEVNDRVDSFRDNMLSEFEQLQTRVVTPARPEIFVPLSAGTARLVTIVHLQQHAAYILENLRGMFMVSFPVEYIPILTHIASTITNAVIRAWM